MSDGEITEWPITKPEDGQGGTKDGITDIACDSGDPSGMADRDPAFFYYDRRKRSGMDCHCDCADMHSEDPEMRSDHDNRHGNHLSCGKFVPENVIARPRPCAVDPGVTLKIPFPSEYSFPSGHTSNGFAGAVTIFSYYRKAGILSLLVAAIIAFSRLYFFVHYPTDILGGIVLGTLDALLAVYLVKRLEDRADAKTVSDNDKTGHR